MSNSWFHFSQQVSWEGRVKVTSTFTVNEDGLVDSETDTSQHPMRVYLSSFLYLICILYVYILSCRNILYMLVIVSANAVLPVFCNTAADRHPLQQPSFSYFVLFAYELASKRLGYIMASQSTWTLRTLFQSQPGIYSSQPLHHGGRDWPSQRQHWPRLTRRTRDDLGVHDDSYVHAAGYHRCWDDFPFCGTWWICMIFM